jgi:hypothetical protein
MKRRVISLAALVVILIGASLIGASLAAVKHSNGKPATPALTQTAGTAPLRKLCSIPPNTIPGINFALVTDVGPSQNCAIGAQEIQSLSNVHQATFNGFGNMLSSDGGVQLFSHTPDSGMWIFDVQLPTGAVDANMWVQPSSEIRPGQTKADDVQFEANHLGVFNGLARWQIVGFDSTTRLPVPDAQIQFKLDTELLKTLLAIDSEAFGEFR